MDQPDFIRIINNIRLVLKDSALADFIQNISVGELLEVSDSDFKVTAITLIGIMIAELFSEMGAPGSDWVLRQTRRTGRSQVFFEQQKESFINKFKITEKDELLLTKVLEDVPLKRFPEEAGISSSSANKSIRRLWERLGLDCREQLLFVAGWMRLLSPGYECLKHENDE
jgi:hypothetical protein